MKQMVTSGFNKLTNCENLEVGGIDVTQLTNSVIINNGLTSSRNLVSEDALFLSQ